MRPAKVEFAARRTPRLIGLLLLCVLLFGVAEASRFSDAIAAEPAAQLTTSRLHHANLLFAAELSAVYPHEQIFILARDSEYLYFLLHSLLEGREEQKRIHYLIANRVNKTDPLFGRYIRQLGIGEREGVLVDTGYTGSIVKSIREAASGKKIRVHFLTSANESIPESRLFLDHFSPSGWVPKPFKEKFRHYNLFFRLESALPHAFARSTTFTSAGEIIVPVQKASPPREAAKAAALRRETAAFGADAQTRREFDQLTKSMRSIADYVLNRSRVYPAEALEKLSAEVGNSFLADLMEVARVQKVNDAAGRIAQLAPAFRRPTTVSANQRCWELYSHFPY